MSAKEPLPIIGWREIVQLPQMGLVDIPAKIDSGARTSSLHATDIEEFERDGKKFVRFVVAMPGGIDAQLCEAVQVDIRGITSSNGETQQRYVIKTQLKIGMLVFRAEVSLADRSDMRFPMLIGRSSLRRRFVVDSGHSWLQSPGRRPEKGYKT